MNIPSAIRVNDSGDHEHCARAPPAPVPSALTTLVARRAAQMSPQGYRLKSGVLGCQESEVDPYGKVVRCRSKNLDHVKVMQVEETQLFEETRLFEETLDGWVTIAVLYSNVDDCTAGEHRKLQRRKESRFMVWLDSKPTFREWIHLRTISFLLSDYYHF